jgi:hypothetical protein
MGPVSLLKVLVQYDISILTDSMHPRLFADRGDISTTELVRAGNEILKVYFVSKVHFCGNGLENEALLAAIWNRELYLAI